VVFPLDLRVVAAPVSQTPEEWGLEKMALALIKDDRATLLPVCLLS
jgi:hypothetical protein